MRINGLDYELREAALRRRGIDPDGSDEAFGAEVYCSQHLRVHSTGWCTVDNRAKWVQGDPICPRCGDGLPDCATSGKTHEQTCATYVYADEVCDGCAAVTA